MATPLSPLTCASIEGQCPGAYAHEQYDICQECAEMQGITFVNQYIIVGTLGQGAFGKVKLVLNSTDMNLYAVKLLSKGSLMRHQRMRPRTASDFQVEAQRRMNVIRLLHHPNIICPFEVIGAPFWPHQCCSRGKLNLPKQFGQ